MGGVPFPSSRSKTNEAAKHVERPLPGRLDGGSIPPGSTGDEPRRGSGGVLRSKGPRSRFTLAQAPPRSLWIALCSAASGSGGYLPCRPWASTNARSRPGQERLHVRVHLAGRLTCRPSPLRSPHRSPRHRCWGWPGHLRSADPAAGRRCTSPGWRPGTPCSTRW